MTPHPHRFVESDVWMVCDECRLHLSNLVHKPLAHAGPATFMSGDQYLRNRHAMFQIIERDCQIDDLLKIADDTRPDTESEL